MQASASSSTKYFQYSLGTSCGWARNAMLLAVTSVQRKELGCWVWHACTTMQLHVPPPCRPCCCSIS
jgi:hypothetical protein